MSEHKTVGSLIGAIRRATQSIDKTSAWRAPLTKIGMLITALAKLNARRLGVVGTTGRLINSINYFVFQEGKTVGVQVGSFGVPYAAINEFGGPFTAAMRRAMFATLKARNSQVKPRKSKGFAKAGRFPPRPYLRRAMVQSRSQILDILRSAIGSGA